MNLRFPEVFGIVLFLMLVFSFALPRSVSGRVENTFQFIFAPVTGPIQWMTAGREKTRADEPIFTNVSDEVTRLRAEKLALQNYVEVLHGQIETLEDREKEASRLGKELGESVTIVKVIGPDAAGRDLLRLAGTSSGTIEKDEPVVTVGGLVGRIQDVGLGNQSSVRLITDRGFKLLARFGRYEQVGDGGTILHSLPISETVIEGTGSGLMHSTMLKMSDVDKAGMREGDILFLSDDKTTTWPIEVHGYRIGKVSKIIQKMDTPGVADITVMPDADLLKLKEVWVVTKKP